MSLPPTNPDLINPGFETGDLTGWTVVRPESAGTASVNSVRPYAGQYAGFWKGASGSGHIGGVDSIWYNDARGTVAPGQSVNAQFIGAFDDTDSSGNRAEVRLYWYDEDEVEISFDSGNLLRGNSESYRTSAVTAQAPANAAYVKMALWITGNTSGGVYADEAKWNYTYTATAELLNPPDGAVYGEDATVPLSVTITGSNPTAVSVVYKSGTDTIGSSAAAPFNVNVNDLDAGEHVITAEVTMSDGSVITTAAHTITVTATPPTPITREFKASNAYSQLVASNFSSLASSIPSAAKVTAVETIVDYDVDVLVRSKDIGNANIENSNPNVVFDMTDGGTLHMIMLQETGDGYNKLGSKYTASVPLERSDFSITEEGTSEGKKWTVFSATGGSVTIGSEDDLFSLSPVVMNDFIKRGLGFKFTPNLQVKPDYADTGDAVIRFKIDKLHTRVYFDAGSVEYYFYNGDDCVIKGRLVSADVLDGNFETADASGDMQLAPDLEQVEGDCEWIEDGWTIHAAYPPTNDNQIGVVSGDMTYNGLPTQQQVKDNRSRYVNITANFYADKDLDSIYGAHGLPRAFAYNGDFFYKIYTQADPVKDSPRHVAYHQGHLALGYEEGRIDISVVGQPYNFDGQLGASTWSIGDRVVGLLELSGTILGVFGSKSVWGISGTTVDNFATQVISPNIGATEYTVADMGFPVYANAYGIYTLSQTQQYGDYLGTPMSQDISPWLRPRLLRKATSDKEVVVAWPVRSKNQYRLAFSDGYVTSMTLNGAATPTFSLQKYFIGGVSGGSVFTQGATFEQVAN